MVSISPKVFLFCCPSFCRYMRGSESTYDELDTDDQVEDMARILRRDFLEKGEDGKGVMDTVLADLLSNKALQEQATKFVVGILESEEVKAAGQRFLKDLWDDLIKDPETTAQVIFLLNVAIQNDDIRLAVKKLVLEIVEDEEVLEELVRLLQKLGQDQEVRWRVVNEDCLIYFWLFTERPSLLRSQTGTRCNENSLGRKRPQCLE